MLTRLSRLISLWSFLGAASSAGWPGDTWPTATPAEAGLDAAKLAAAHDYALTGGGSGCIIHRGQLVLRWGDPAQLYDLKSTSKSIGVTLLGVALKDGKIRLDDPAVKHHPRFGVPPDTNAATGWLEKVTLRMLADQTAGFEKQGGYQPLLFAPGTQWHYSDSGPNWLAECLTLAGFPRDACWSWGLYDSLIVVVPSLDLVIARAGKSWARTPGADHYAVLKPFLETIAAAVPKAGRAAAYPPSPVIAGLTWDPPEKILRLAKGSDNWPMTWADNDALYTAYGDGNGFVPFVPRKLSLGLARLTGAPPAITGANLRSATAEAHGDGKRGRKASGLLMVDGVLYLLVRNASHAQLGWSRDHGATWTWADWTFTTSFDCPTFLNCGKNYAGARDDFVYVYSQDADSAYDRADRMVLARVPMQRLPERDAYEFFVALDAQSQPTWIRDVHQRGAVFSNPGACYRSGITYHAALKRYLWCQIGPGNDTRFQGGFAIYDAPEPWGPWTTAFHTDAWDVGPGESSSLPTKWMSADGRTVHLVFSGDDHFSVRRATVTLRSGVTR